MKKCGVILYNMDVKKYLLVYGLKSQKWGFPKGHMEVGETEEETALRELREETGIYITHNLNRKIRYRNNIYFFVQVKNHEVPNTLCIEDKNEIAMAQWFSEEEILNIHLDHCNFGLKNWIHQFLSLSRSNLYPNNVLKTEMCDVISSKVN